MPLGDVVDGEVQMSLLGRLADRAWCWLAGRHPYVRLDAHIVMPNHLHGILWIVDDCVGTVCKSSPVQQPPLSFAQHKPLGRLIGAFKTVSTKWANYVQKTPGDPLWQRGYYEHIIRSERALQAIRRYIVENPLRWNVDRYNPAACGPDPAARDLWRLLRQDL